MSDFEAKKRVKENLWKEVTEVEGRIHKLEKSIESKKVNLKNMKDGKKSKQFAYSSADCEKIESEYISKRK